LLQGKLKQKQTTKTNKTNLGVMLHIVEKIILTMNKVNEIVSKYAERLKSFGIKLSAEGEIEAAAPVRFAVAILKDGIEVSSPDEMIAVGSPLFVKDAEGNEVPAPDGKHETAEGKFIVTVGGVVTEILEPEMESDVVEEEQAAAFDGVSKEEFEATISALIEQFESRINSLTAEKTELSAQVEKLSKQPATNSVKKSSVSVNAAPINLAKMDSKNRIFAIINKYK
jgi:hypothetical protein